MGIVFYIKCLSFPQKDACQPNNGHCILSDIVGIHKWELAIRNTEEHHCDLLTIQQAYYLQIESIMLQTTHLRKKHEFTLKNEHGSLIMEIVFKCLSLAWMKTSSLGPFRNGWWWWWWWMGGNLQEKKVREVYVQVIVTSVMTGWVSNFQKKSVT